MAKVNDLKQYWKELAVKAGMDESDTATMLGLLDKDAAKKAFAEGFKPLPDYSHDLDDTRTRTKAEKDKEYATWFTNEQKKFNEYVAGLDKLKQYETMYGPLDGSGMNMNNDMTGGNGSGNGNGNGASAGLTKEDFEKLLEVKLTEQLSRRDAAVLDLLDVRETHMGTFKKPLDVKAFESAWKEHPEWGGSLKLAYSQFMAPEVEKLKTTEWETKLAAAREEGVRDGFSRRAVPSDFQPKTFSPLFDRKEDVGKLSEGEQEKHSRTAFFEGLREPAKSG